MLSKNDLLLILSEIKDKGIDTSKLSTSLILSDKIPFNVLKFVNDNRPLEISNFYEVLRKSYNNKKSNLYKNIVKEELTDPEEVLVILSSLNLQILLYAKKLEDNRMFLNHSRAKEITEVLNNYYKSYDLIPCLKLLKLIKADLKCFEAVSKIK